MPRNASGVYSLPSGNPVVSGAVIQSTWANDTMSDIGDALTGSLARDGSGGMTGPFKTADGTAALPGLSFTNEPSSGIYRAGAGEWWGSVLTAPIFQVSGTGISMATSKVLSLQAGTVGSPSLTFASDNNTGIWSPAADVVAFSTNGVERLRLNNTGASVTGAIDLTGDITLNGGTANGVAYLNGSKVLTSGSALTFDGTNLTQGAGGSAASNQTLTLNGTDNAANGAGILGKRNGVNTWAISDTAWALGSGTGLMFYNYGTAPWIWQLGTGGEQMRLTSTGLGIGTSSPSGYRVRINAPDRGLYVTTAGATAGLPAAYLSDATHGVDAVLSPVAGAVRFGSFTNHQLDLVTNNTIKATLDASGNLGLGVTPSAWNSGSRAIDIGASGAIQSGNGINVGLWGNAVYNTSAQFVYKTTAAATYYSQESGTHRFFTAPSGTAGNAISFTQAMTLTSGGALLLGQTATKANEVLRVAASGVQSSLMLDNSSNTNGSFVGVFNDAALFGVNRNPSTGVFYNTSNYAAEVIAVGSSSTSYLAFGTSSAANTAPTERARIDSSGNFGLGSSSPSTYGKFVVEGTGSFTNSFVSTSSTLTDKPTLEFRKTMNTASLNVNSLGRISFNGKLGSTAQEEAYLSVTAQNISNTLNKTTVRLGVYSEVVGATLSSLTLETADTASLEAPNQGIMQFTTAGLDLQTYFAKPIVFSTNGSEAFRILTTNGITSASLADAVGYKGLPQNAQTSAYTLALTDMGKHISITTGGVVIPANGSVAFPIGSAVTIFNNSGSNQTISITTDTLRQAGTANTGSRTLAQYGIATVVKVSSTVWVISGAGLS